MPEIPQPPTAADIKQMLLGGTANFKEIAAALGCSERTIYRLNLPYILVAGRRHAVLALAREKLMANMQRATRRRRGRPAGHAPARARRYGRPQHGRRELRVEHSYLRHRASAFACRVGGWELPGTPHTGRTC